MQGGPPALVSACKHNCCKTHLVNVGGLLKKQKGETTHTHFLKTRSLTCCNIAKIRHKEDSVSHHV